MNENYEVTFLNGILFEKLLSVLRKPISYETENVDIIFPFKN